MLASGGSSEPRGRKIRDRAQPEERGKDLLPPGVLCHVSLVQKTPHNTVVLTTDNRLEEVM